MTHPACHSYIKMMSMDEWTPHLQTPDSSQRLLVMSQLQSLPVEQEKKKEETGDESTSATGSCWVTFP